MEFDPGYGRRWAGSIGIPHKPDFDYYITVIHIRIMGFSVHGDSVRGGSDADRPEPGQLWRAAHCPAGISRGERRSFRRIDGGVVILTILGGDDWGLAAMPAEACDHLPGAD
jgi:hypothetical protein